MLFVIQIAMHFTLVYTHRIKYSTPNISLKTMYDWSQGRLAGEKIAFVNDLSVKIN